MDDHDEKIALGLTVQNLETAKFLSFFDKDESVGINYSYSNDGKFRDYFDCPAMNGLKFLSVTKIKSYSFFRSLKHEESEVNTQKLYPLKKGLIESLLRGAKISTLDQSNNFCGCLSLMNNGRGMNDICYNSNTIMGMN